MKYRANASEPFQDLYIKALDSMPIGMMVDFVGTDIPNGWLICDGRTLDAETYPELYDALGGSGSTFTLPDCKGRVLVGYDANDTDFNAIGKTGGEKTHTLTIDEMPKHNHKVFYTDTGGGGNLARLNASGSQTPTTEAGGDQPHNNLQPYYVAYKIIKAKNTTPTMASIVNTTNSSTTDAYSCDYANKYFGGVVLYSGYTSGNITLSDSASNYSYIEVYGQKSGCYGYVKIYNPNGKQFGLAIHNAYDSNSIQQIFGRYTISGTTITKNFEVYMNNNGSPANSNDIKIEKVIGYK